MAQSQYLPFAAEPGANIVSQPDWQADTDRQFGFGQGQAISAKFNKAWRQSSTVAAAITAFIADYSYTDVVDDGDVVRLKNMFTTALTDLLTGAGAQPGPLAVTEGGTGASTKQQALSNLGITISTVAPNGGNDGDIWFKVS